ncbi:OmpP1/FadL family transporter [Allohahella marinimesophila]|uniref:OmpP1/FadL family transporter n=1 Tax=Allohahella marinimesophila TaxID=1054972 RepID=UPI0031E1C052
MKSKLVARPANCAARASGKSFSKGVAFPLLALALVTQTAQAQLATNLITSPKALALGNAVTADTPGIAAIHFNPAGLTKLEGRNLNVTLLNIRASIQTKFDAPPGYNIFGIDGVENDPILSKSGNGRTITLAAYLPGWGIIRLPKGPGVLPSTGFSYNPPGSKFTFGNMTYAPDLVGYYRSHNDPGRYLAKAAVLQRFTYLSPTVAYQIDDQWSVGMGIHFSQQAIAIDTFARAPNLLVGVAEELQTAFNCETGNEPLAPFLGLCGGDIGPWDDIGGITIETQETLSPKYVLGVTWTPTDWFSWGASYTSEAKMKLKGQFEVQYSEDWQGFWQRFTGSLFGAIGGAIFGLPSGVPKESGNVSMDFTHPAHFQTGVSVKVNHGLTLNADLGWTDYSSWDAFDFTFDRPLEFLGAARLLSPNATETTLTLPLEYQDVWNLALGAEFHATSRLDLRLGVEFRDSPIPRNRRDTAAPLGDATLYGAGLGYKWDRDSTIDVAIGYLRSAVEIPPNTSLNANSTAINNIILNPYAGLNIRTTTKIVQAAISFTTKF